MIPSQDLIADYNRVSIAGNEKDRFPIIYRIGERSSHKPKTRWEEVLLYTWEGVATRKVFGQLVLLGYGVTTFIPVAYQPNSLLGSS